jgi:hypothetical protein
MPLKNGILATINPGELLLSEHESVLSLMIKSKTEACLVRSNEFRSAANSHQCPRDPNAIQIRVCLGGSCENESDGVKFGGMQALVTLSASLREWNSVLLDKQGRVWPPR